MSDMTIQCNEEMVGAGHLTKADTLNRLALVEADADGHGKTRFLKAQAAAPPTPAGEGALYTKTVGGHVEVFYRAESSGAELQLTSNGRLNLPPIPISMQDMIMNQTYPGANVTLGSGVYSIPAIALADGATQGFQAVAILPDSTRSYQLVIECAQSTAVASKAIVLGVGIDATQAGEDPARSTLDVNAQQTIATRDDIGKLIIANANFKIDSSFLHTDYSLVRLGIYRYGADAADTHTGVTNIYSVYFRALP